MMAVDQIHQIIRKSWLWLKFLPSYYGQHLDFDFLLISSDIRYLCNHHKSVNLFLFLDEINDLEDLQKCSLWLKQYHNSPKSFHKTEIIPSWFEFTSNGEYWMETDNERRWQRDCQIWQIKLLNDVWNASWSTARERNPYSKKKKPQLFWNPMVWFDKHDRKLDEQQLKDNPYQGDGWGSEKMAQNDRMIKVIEQLDLRTEDLGKWRSDLSSDIIESKPMKAL
jgi:hypothetical protein